MKLGTKLGILMFATGYGALTVWDLTGQDFTLLLATGVYAIGVGSAMIVIGEPGGKS